MILPVAIASLINRFPSLAICSNLSVSSSPAGPTWANGQTKKDSEDDNTCLLTASPGYFRYPGAGALLVESASLHCPLYPRRYLLIDGERLSHNC
jgi:hypothetical protein